MAGTPIKSLFPAGVCGARNRKGNPCAIRLAVHKCKNGRLRCKYHGGLSTGPRTPEGKARSLAAMREGLERWRATRTAPDSPNLPV